MDAQTRRSSMAPHTLGSPHLPAEEVLPPRGRLAQLWQLPLLLLSLGLFAYAAYLFIDPKPGLTTEQKIDLAAGHLKHERPEAAVEHVRKLLASERLAKENEARLHLMLAEGLEMLRRHRNLDLPVHHQQIIDHSRLALAQGVKPAAAIYRRLGESHEALGRPDDALESYRRAMALDPEKAPRLQRKVIDLQLARSDLGPAEQSLGQYLKDPQLTDSERAWALGERSKLLVDRGNFIEARALINEALRMDPDPVSQGQFHYRLGYCAWKLGDTAEAERLLRAARNQLKVQHPQDADAALLLGRILQARDDTKGAASFFQSVLVSHPASPAVTPARLGRGLCRIRDGEDEAGLTDLHDVVNEIAARPARAVHKAEALTGLKESSQVLVSRGNFQGALDAMALEQELQDSPPAEFFARLSSVYEKRATQVKATVAAAANSAEQVRRQQQVRDLLTRAGDAAIAHSRALTLADDKGYGEAMWRGTDLYDAAGNLQEAMSALELFIAERPDDGLAADALLRLGRTYQAAGLFDKAILAFQRNQFRYPQTLAASRSGVPLAQAYIAKGADSYVKAEAALLKTLESEVITPDAEEFRDALFELAQLYYRIGRYEESVTRLEELVERYPNETRMGQLLFLMADSYRKSAALLKEAASKPRPASATVSAAPTGTKADAAVLAGQLATQAEAAAARRERLNKAKRLYDRVVEQFRTSPPAREVDQLYLKLAHFYRADCLFDNGSFEEAIRLYDAAALRYQEDPSALAAYVQIVNAYYSLGKFEEAKTANERAKWLLRKMPPESFQDGRFAMPKEYWENWLKWTNSAGMW